MSTIIFKIFIFLGSCLAHAEERHIQFNLLDGCFDILIGHPVGRCLINKVGSPPAETTVTGDAGGGSSRRGLGGYEDLAAVEVD